MTEDQRETFRPLRLICSSGNGGPDVKKGPGTFPVVLKQIVRHKESGPRPVAEERTGEKKRKVALSDGWSPDTRVPLLTGPPRIDRFLFGETRAREKKNTVYGNARIRNRNE